MEPGGRPRRLSISPPPQPAHVHKMHKGFGSHHATQAFAITGLKAGDKPKNRRKKAAMPLHKAGGRSMFSQKLSVLIVVALLAAWADAADSPAMVAARVDQLLRQE